MTKPVIGPSRNATLQLAFAMLRKAERGSKKQEAPAPAAPAKKLPKKTAAKTPARKKGKAK